MKKMKKIYLTLSVCLASIAMIAQTPEAGNALLSKVIPISKAATDNRTIICPDTAGLINFTDFLPEFAPNGSASFYSYSGGGYVYGNNISSNQLRIVAQGYDNINGSQVSVQGVILWFGGKQSDGTTTANSKVVVSGFDMAPNMARNTNGSGTYNNTVNNWDGPTGAAKCSADLLFSAIDTNTNYVPFSSNGVFNGDFAFQVDFASLDAGDTTGLVSDAKNDANNLDYAYHQIAGNWHVTDQLFSAPGSPSLGSGNLDNSIAIWPVLCEVTGVAEFFNGMKLTSYPNPAADKATIEYSLEKDSKNVTLNVFDQLGRVVYSTKYDEQNAGTYKVTVETINIASGNYFYQLNANGNMFTKKFSVAK